MKALVTGARGFVGTHLMAHLEAAGDDAVATDRTIDDLDILDAPALLQLFRKVQPEVVYHLAGAADVGGSWDTPGATFRANAEGTLNVLWAARETGVERVLAVGSADVYGKVTPEDLPLTEESPIRPVSPYAASKVASDAVAYQAFLGHGQQVVRTRPFNHLGPGQSDRFVAPALAARVAANERSGEQVLKAGNLSLPALLDLAEADEMVGRCKVLSALESMPGIGKVRARRLLTDLGISESRRLRGLGDVQRRRLLEQFA